MPLYLLALKSVDWLGIPRDPSATQPSADPPNSFATFALLAIALLLLLWLIARVHSRIHSPARPYRPYQLFARLLKYHGLGLRDRVMLYVMAGCRRMRQPTLLLMSPTFFAEHAEAWLTRSLVGSAWPGARPKLARIAGKVFTDASPADSKR